MYIIIDMALIAVRLSIFIYIREMAFFTLYCCMHADEWECCKVMVEQNIAVPAFFIVTVVALLTLFAFMDIVCFVTVDALCVIFLYSRGYF